MNSHVTYLRRGLEPSIDVVVTKIIFHLKKENFLLLLLLKKPFNWYSLKKIKNISNDRMCFELIKNISWRYYRQQLKFKFRNSAGLPVVFGYFNTCLGFQLWCNTYLQGDKVATVFDAVAPINEKLMHYI